MRGAGTVQRIRLRRSLPDGVIESTGNGYRLSASMIDLDAERLAAAAVLDRSSTQDVTVGAG
jgi:hypothetical protein